MEYLMNSAGIGVPCIREYETDSTDDIAKGAVMSLVKGKAVKASNASPVLGILAEDYKAEKNELNPRGGSGRVKIIVSPGIICRQKHQRITVNEKGTPNNIKIAGIPFPSESGAFLGGYIRLVSKAENSENTDCVGKPRRITASSGASLSVEFGGTPCVGDVYEILPPAGYAYIVLSGDGTKYEFSGSKNMTAQVVSCLPESGCTEIGFTKTFLN